jgi:hypothetical protein
LLERIEKTTNKLEKLIKNKKQLSKNNWKRIFRYIITRKRYCCVIETKAYEKHKDNNIY